MYRKSGEQTVILWNEVNIIDMKQLKKIDESKRIGKLSVNFNPI